MIRAVVDLVLAAWWLSVLYLSEAAKRCRFRKQAPRLAPRESRKPATPPPSPRCPKNEHTWRKTANESKHLPDQVPLTRRRGGGVAVIKLDFVPVQAYRCSRCNCRGAMAEGICKQPMTVFRFLRRIRRYEWGPDHGS